MNKRTHLYWIPCVAHYIDLMLEDIGKIKEIRVIITKGKAIISLIYNSTQAVNILRSYIDGHDLLRPGITRFAIEHVALESLVRYKSQLQKCFTDYRFLTTLGIEDRKKKQMVEQVSDIVLTHGFWNKVDEVLKGMGLLVHVLKIVDQDKKPTMTVIYEALDRVKESIKDKLPHGYKKFWDCIDARWDNTLHNDLHAAGNK